jgi:hypothetical protein
MDTRTVLVPATLLLVAIGAALYANTRNIGTFEDPNLMNRGLNTPAIWIYVDDTDVNSRWWADFGARSSRVYNMPFLNLCYQSIVKAAGQRYHVEVISGIGDAESRLGGLPVGMSRKKLPLRDEEMTYLRVAFLEKFGGLWLGPATICIRDIPELPKEHVAFIGSDPLETYAGPKGTFIPNQNAMWSPRPHHPTFVKWRQMLSERIDRQAGGKEIRNDKVWDLLFNSTGRQDIQMMPSLELTRKANGRKIELEDLLAAGTEGRLPFDVPPHSVFVPFPWPELMERRMFGWFLRMSEEQVMESDLVATWLFRAAGVSA